MASLAALAAAGVAAVALPPAVYQARAIVAVDEPSTALRLATARSAADLAVSKSVIARTTSSLNGTARPAGSGDGSPETADDLIARVTADAGDGFVELRARAVDPARAARTATALADALLLEEDAASLSAARHRETAGAATLAALRATARAAHDRLAALGEAEVDPSETLPAAATAARAADARLAAVRAVIAAGSPPLGAGSDLPQKAAALQEAYWDLKKQLDKASETLGERHTTVIALRDGVARAAAALTAEWTRIEHAAAGDATAARSREASLRKATAMAPARRTVVEDARAAVRSADAALARAAAPLAAGTTASSFRLIAPAGVPAAPVGLDAPQRLFLAGSAGAIVFALALLLPRRRPRAAFAPGAETRAAADLVAVSPRRETHDATTLRDLPPQHLPFPDLHAVASTEPDFAERGEPLFRSEVMRSSFMPPYEHGDDIVSLWKGDPIGAMPDADVASTPCEPDVGDPAEDDLFGAEDSTHEVALPSERSADAADDDAEPRLSEMEDAAYAASAADELAPESAGSAVGSDMAPPTAPALEADLRDAFRAIVAEIPNIETRHAVPTMLVASNTVGGETGAVALALAEAAVEHGYRVLVIAGDGEGATLAEAVAAESPPLLVDASGMLRVAFPAQNVSNLFVAPAFADSAATAIALAEQTDIELLHDLEVLFDLVVIDGGRAIDGVAAGWSADAYIRVGPSDGRDEDDLMMRTFDAREEALLGTVVVMPPASRETDPAGRPVLHAITNPCDVAPTRRAPPASPPPIRTPSRRRVGVR